MWVEHVIDHFFQIECWTLSKLELTSYHLRQLYHDINLLLFCFNVNSFLALLLLLILHVFFKLDCMNSGIRDSMLYIELFSSFSVLFRRINIWVWWLSSSIVCQFCFFKSFVFFLSSFNYFVQIFRGIILLQEIIHTCSGFFFWMIFELS